MSAKILRVFLGFDLPREVPQRVAALRTLVEDPRQAVRWVQGANIHLTVRFLGATPQGAVNEIDEALQVQLASFQSLRVQITGTGVFPAATRPRIIWLGVSGQTERLQALEEAIHQVVGPLGFPRERREFSPHVTIGRVRYPQKITPDVTNFLKAEYTPVECPLEKLVLFESRPADKGVIYPSLASFQLTSAQQEKS